MPVLRENESITEINEDLRLIQHREGLTFGTDAYLLASFMREKKNAAAIDMGAGTGIISLLCAAKEKFKNIFCVEVQQSFADIIGRNAELNGLSHKIKVLCRDVRNLTHADTGGEVDVVFSNPPYMKTDSGKRNDADEKYIARHEVCGTIDDFCRSAAKMLRHGGLFYCVYRPDRLVDLIAALRGARLEPKRMTFVCARVDSEPSMVLVEAKLGGAPGVRVTEPLILTDEKGNQTERARQIYEKCNF